MDALSKHSSCFSSSFLRGSRATLECEFEEGADQVRVYLARPKTCSRMAEKLREYRPPHHKGIWPLTANILDPIRLSIVCSGTSQIVQVARWLMELQGELGLCVRQVKNRFVEEAAEHGYRDLKLYLTFCGEEGVRVIGEVQLQDAVLYRHYMQMHRLYKLQRAQSMQYYLHETSW
eukprot:768386-Hanusia_phi.AAC.3